MPGAVGRIWSWIKWPAALALVAFLFYRYRAELSEFSTQQKDWRFLWGALILCSTGMIVTIVRWHLLVWALDIPFRMRDAFRLSFMGMLLNYAGPGLVGGDMFKGLFIAREQKSRKAVAAATVLLDRVLGLLSLFLLGSIATMLLRNPPRSGLHTAIFWTLWGGSAAGIAGLVILLQPALTRWSWIRKLGNLPYVGRIMVDVLNGITLYQSKPRVLVLATLLGIASHTALISGFYCCALGLGGWAPDLITHLYFMPAAEVVGLLPTPMGIGPLEWAISEAYGSASSGQVSSEAAKAAGLFATIAFRVVNLLIASTGALCFLPAWKEVGVVLQEVKK